MSNIFTYEPQDIDLKECIKIRTNCEQLDTITLQFNVYDYDSPVDLSNYNIAFEAIKSNGDFYIQVNNITTNGNMITIACKNQLTSVIGKVNGMLRLWTNDFSQKSSYIIVLNVFGINNDISISRNFVDILEQIEININHAITLNNTFQSDIDTATIYKNALETSCSNALDTKIIVDNTNTNALNTNNLLKNSINDGKSTKEELDATIVTANKTSIDSLIQEAGILKQDLINSVPSMNAHINNLDIHVTENQKNEWNNNLLLTQQLINLIDMFTNDFNITDENGSYLTDENGNYLVL